MPTDKLTGVIAAVATAVDETGAPDAARSTKLARFLLDTGCDGLNVLGTTGEATSFSLEQRKAVMSAYKSAGLPLDRLMVGTGAAATADAVALNPELAAPYPFNRLSGPANVLVMPAFHSASISTKMLQELGGATVIGPLIVGLEKPVQIVPLGAKDSDIVNMAALASFNIGG